MPNAYRHLQIVSWVLLVGAILALIVVTSAPLSAHDDGSHPHQGHPPLHAQDTMRAFKEDHQEPKVLPAQSLTACVGGSAGGYPCNNVDLLAFLPLNQMGGGNGNDIWGWTDPLDGKEYAIMGRSNGTSFVDISDPVNPLYLGNLPPHASNSSWRDIKVYNNHAFIVTEANNSGMQVFDLTQLRNVTSPGGNFTETAYYNGFLTAHNLVINEDSGYAYAVGVNSGNCGRGLHIINIQDPLNPTAAGCFGADGYTHDAQCVIYDGPDVQHQGREICLNSNEDTLTIADVTNKSAPVQLSRTDYAGRHYTHQGWLTEDHTYFLLDDELDERDDGVNTRTLIWDLSDLDNPVYAGDYISAVGAIDHNQYILGNYSYQANYQAGLRILDISDIANANLSEAAYFDIYPSGNSANFNGAWSNYPYFDSGVVIVSGIEQGLYILQPNLATSQSPPNINIVSPAESATVSGPLIVQITATDAQDPAGSLDVQWKLDAGSWLTTTYNGGTGIYEASWDVDLGDPGAHVLYAQAIDSNSEQGSDSNNVTVSSGSLDFHVQSIEITAVHNRGPRYFGRAIVTMVDVGDSPLIGVTVNGSFNGDWIGSVSGTTDAGGQVVLETPPVKNGSTWSFCVDSAARGGWNYDSAANIETCDPSSVTGEISGRVADAATGLPLVVAVVTTSSGQSTTTDNNGDYTLSNVPVGSPTVSASFAGYVTVQKAVTVIEGLTTTADFALSEEVSGGATGSIKGTVTDDNGIKLAGVTVITDSGHSAVTNRGGKYTIQNVPEGSRDVTASKSGFVDGLQNIVVIAGQTTTVNFSLAPGP
jgi:choice-of-anchor B domain-containing protein